MEAPVWLKPSTVIILGGICFIWIMVLFQYSRPGVSRHETQSDLQPGTATSGKLFSGQQYRGFPTEQMIFSSLSALPNAGIRSQSKFSCTKWSVVTTIFEPSDAIRKQANLGPDWCMVIVGDRKSPIAYPVSGSSPVVYLNADDQVSYGQKFPELFSALPWNHFGRKNVGFLYAIEQGAEFIWDFDDDNILKDDKLISTPGDYDPVSVHIPKHHQLSSYNPYVKFGAPHLPAWPRGIPLLDIKNDASWNAELQQEVVAGREIGLIQSLADHDPDMDAIYRLTQPLPFNFDVPGNALPIMLPSGTLSPLNAQACLFRQAAFWMLLLPITVHGRVSDIWRGYIGQRILWDLGLHVAFSPPLVNQFRNPHNYLADLDSEIPLYMRSGTLVEFLRQWKGSRDTLPGIIEELYVELYERGYIEIEDVRLQQYWLQALLNVGYTFPKLQHVSKVTEH